MLPVERGDNLPGIEVGERDDLHLGEAECLFHRSRDATELRLVDASAQDRRHFDLDLRPIRAKQ